MSEGREGPVEHLKPHERESSNRITPQVARFTVASVAPEFWNPDKLATHTERSRLRDSLNNKREVDIEPLVKAKINKFDATPEDPTAEAQWHTFRQEWLDWYRENPQSDPTVHAAIKSLRIHYDAGILFRHYLDLHPRDKHTNREQSVVYRVRSFMDSMIRGCTEEDRTINMTTLRERLLALHPMLHESGLIQATMADAILRMPPQQKMPALEEILNLTSAHQDLGEEHIARFKLLARLSSGDTEQSALVDDESAAEVITEENITEDLNEWKSVIEIILTNDIKKRKNLITENRSYREPFNSIKKVGAEHFDKMRELAEGSARRRQPEERTGVDRYVLATSRNRPLDLSIMDTFYYEKIATHLLEGLQSDRLPQGFEDPSVWEKTIDLLVAKNMSKSYGYDYSDLKTTLELMVEATKKVPGFNPMNAGFAYLNESAILLVALAQKALNGSDLEGLASDCLSSVEETMAALFQQGRENLLFNKNK